MNHPLASLARDTEAQRKSQCEKSQRKREADSTGRKPLPLPHNERDHRERPLFFMVGFSLCAPLLEAETQAFLFELASLLISGLFSHRLFLCASVSLASEASGW